MTRSILFHQFELPTEPVAWIRLKDPESTIKTRNYPCPRTGKWKEAWHTLLQQHFDAGRIRPSDVPTGSGAFIIPKSRSHWDTPRQATSDVLTFLSGYCDHKS
jgi:hypothetical protein